MRIFIDTEFTDLKHPKLISIALVTEDGQEFYREMLDGWKLPDCTHFVLGWVLPLLSDGRTGRKLYNKLQSHLDLIQFECDADNLFPKSKEPLLDQALQGDSELLEHLGWISRKKEVTDLKIARNKFVINRIGGYQLDNLIVGDQAQPREQVKQDLLVWLNRFQKVEICCDSDFDYMLLKEMLERQLEWQLIENRAVRHPEWRVHHALDDAREMMKAFFKPGETHY